ncbi:MAG TPA: hydroxymethylbilane synthase [Miltoncostaeaceae bacterium]|nr:hydroxymethylbilane synthase [Miltoncostaeaceae bacterium]
MAGPIVLATRRSPLALAQTRAVAAALEARGHAVTLREVVTTGDRWSARDAAPLPDRGMFVKELEEALLAGGADLAVHSAKDLPTELPPGLAIVAVPARADARDVLVGAPGPDALAPGARVGTGSPRRSAQLRALRPDLDVVGIRGNVDTRLAKLDRGEVDALVLAAAGLARLGIDRPDALPLAVEVSTPAPGQGLLAIEGRAGDDAAAAAAAAALDDAEAALCLRTERAVLAALGGGCLSPVGVHCVSGGGRLAALAFRADDAHGAGAARVRVEGDGSDPAGLAAEVARRLARTIGEVAPAASPLA